MDEALSKKMSSLIYEGKVGCNPSHDAESTDARSVMLQECRAAQRWLRRDIAARFGRDEVCRRNGVRCKTLD